MRKLGRIRQSSLDVFRLQSGVAAQDFRLGSPFSQAVQDVRYQQRVPLAQSSPAQTLESLPK
jgi:hypothetical protein